MACLQVEPHNQTALRGAVMHNLAGSMASWHCSNLDWLYSNAHLTQMAYTHANVFVKVCVSICRRDGH